MEPQQVEHTDRRQGHREEVRALGHGGADEQAPVAAAVEAELPGRRDPGLDKVLSDRDDVVEHVLLGVEPSVVVPP